MPGPACYGRGGIEPTVTDAHVVLGHLPAGLLGGRMALDADKARRRDSQARVAEPLGLSLEDAARGILAIVDNNMVGALRVVSVERGHDPRDFTLAPFGGAGPLHGCALAALLGVTRVLIPPAPGVLCADGLLAADLKAEFSRTLPKAGPVAIEAVEPIFAELDAPGRRMARRGGRRRAGPRQAPRRADALSRAGRRDRGRPGRRRARPWRRSSSPRIRRCTASSSTP